MSKFVDWLLSPLTRRVRREVEAAMQTQTFPEWDMDWFKDPIVQRYVRAQPLQ